MEEQNQNLEQEPQIQQAYTPIPHEELVENKKSWKLILGIVVILSLILLGAGIYWTLNDAETIVENKKVNKINQDEKIVLDIEESNRLDEESTEGWNEIIDYYWAFSMSFPPEMNISMIDGNDGLMSEDKSFIMEIGGSDIIFDLSNESSYQPFIELMEADERITGVEIFSVNNQYIYNYIMKYPEEYGLGMKEYYLLMKDDHVYSASFLLNESENIEEQQLKNRRIINTLKFFKPAARGLDSQISKYTQGVGLSTVVLEGELTEDRFFYPEYSNYNIRNEDNIIVNYINTVYGQIIVYYKDKLTCSKNISIEGNLYRLSPRWATDREVYGYYMDLIDYECVDLNLDIIINSNLETNYEDLLLYNNSFLNFTVKYPSEYIIHVDTNAFNDNGHGGSVMFYNSRNSNVIDVIESDQDLTLKQYKSKVETVYSIIMEEININGHVFVYRTEDMDEYNYFKQTYFTIINKKMYSFSFRSRVQNFSEEEKQKQRDFARSIVETFEIKSVADVDLLTYNNLFLDFDVDLLTYNNSFLSFTVKYPNNFKILEETSELNANKIYKGVAFVPDTIAADEGIISVTEAPLTEEELFDNLLDYEEYLIENSNSDDNIIFDSIENININEKTFVYNSYHMYDTGPFIQKYITMINEKIYGLEFISKIPNFSEEEKQKQRDFTRSIVETFEIK